MKQYPLDAIAQAAHDYSATLPDASQDRALLFSRRYGFASAAIKALEDAGYSIVRTDALSDTNGVLQMNGREQ